MQSSRRDFLRRAGYGIGSAALASTIDAFTVAHSLAQGPTYRALVCIFLGGGNDGNNTLIPIGTNPQATTYRNERGTPTTGPQLGLDPTVLTNNQINPLTGGQPFAMHPALNPLRTLFTNAAARRLAFVCNVGPLLRPLVTPTPRQAYLNNPTLRPNQLFSHSDQVRAWQTADPRGTAQSGWGGRIADRFPPHSSGFPMITSIAGTQKFCIGTLTRPLAIADSRTNLNSVLVLNGFAAGTDPNFATRRTSFNYLRTIDRDNSLVAASSDITDQALQVSQALSTNPVINTVFPQTTLGYQLLQVARVIKANLTQPSLGLAKQIFFVSLGGFDTHKNQVGNQNGLLGQVANAMLAFYNFSVQEGIAGNVTQFTISDFGRTFNPAGSGVGLVGSDHAWGNHTLVLGGAVRGGDFYGVTVPTANGGNGTVYPVLTRSGAFDAESRGRYVPACSLDQYAYTLARWYGLPADTATRDLVFPNLQYFTPNMLNFMM